jgi:DNA-binding transcriptional MerR regulator
MSYSVSQIAQHLGRSGNTVRNRGERFADFLSPGANPPGDAPREYNDDDLLIMQTIEALYRQQLSYDEIEARLDAGERLEIEGPPPKAKRKAGQAQDQTAVVTQEFAAALQQQDSQIQRLQSRIDDLTDRLVDAEKRAAMLQGRLEEREAQEQAETAPWWRFWR